MKEWYGTLTHCLITFAFCFVELGLFTVCFYIGREIAQAEYRYIQAHGGKREECPRLCGFYPEAWTRKSLLDWILPMCVYLWYTLLTSIYYIATPAM